MIPLQAPFTADKIRALKVGDEVLISGVLFTGRDAVHKYLHEGGELHNYQCRLALRDGSRASVCARNSVAATTRGS